MQPPPVRKGPYLKTLKHVHSEQVARLQAKNQHECDLLEDIRNFTKQRSVIEKTYAESLLKVSSQYLNKKIPSIPDLRDEDEDEQWNVWNVWRTVLEENEKLARARLAAVEVFQQQITDDAKTIRHAKLQASKKCLDQLQVVQKEVQYTVQELDRNKKLYFEEEHMAHDARDKARDAEEKLKKKKGSIFSSFTSLQRSSVKFSSKKEACEEKSTGARNDYILALAIANAHSDRYFNVDLDCCLRTLEGDVYEKLKEYLTVLGRTELLTCSAAQNSFSKIRDQAQMLSRDYNVMCCVQYYPVLKQHIRYPFEPCDGDHCSKITCDHGAGAILSREAKNWATKIGKEVKVIRENQRKFQYFFQLRESGNKSDPDDPNGPDLETKLDEMKENIRRAETEKAKAEGVIECLRIGGVNVEEWMQNIEKLNTTLDIPRSSSSTSIKTDTSGELMQKMGQPKPPQQETFYDSDANESSDNKRKDSYPKDSDSEDEEEDIDAHVENERRRMETVVATWDDPTKVDWGDTSRQEPAIETPPASATSTAKRDSWPTESEQEPGIVKCVALYSYTAQNPDELTIVENEHLELIGDGDGDGWVRARNYKGEEGYVPQNYVEAEQGNTTTPGCPLQPQISFSSVDYHVQENQPQPTEEEEEEKQLSNGYLDQDEFPQQFPEEPFPPAAGTTTVSSGGTTPFINELQGEETEGSFCRALYDYEATAPEELSFYEGQIIRVLRRNVHDEDDGWWEGEYSGFIGLFPSIVVEECRWDGEPFSPVDGEIDEEEEDDDASDPPLNPPPPYTPPEAPESFLPPEKPLEEECETMIETVPPSEPQVEEMNVEFPAFEMELGDEKVAQYESWKAEEPTILVSEVPDVTVTAPEIDGMDEIGKDGTDEFGLEVAQIVITAATPMCEEARDFPLDPPAQPESKESSEEGETADFADFAAFTEKPIEETPAEAPVEEETKKTSLEIEEGEKGTILSLGESNESPVTPEELDVQNLAKLESLKESDA